MRIEELSSSAQNLLKVVWAIQEWSAEPVSPTEVAARLGLKLSTVSDSVRKLREAGLVSNEKYGSITLSAAGEAVALKMVRRHCLIESFLVQSLGYSWDQVHEEAESLEHAVSDFMIDRIDQLLGHPNADPHGDPIPSATGKVIIPAATTLNQVFPGKATVVRISDHDSELLQFFAEIGVRPGAELEIAAGEKFTESLLIRVAGGAPVQLGPAAQSAIWVSL